MTEQYLQKIKEKYIDGHTDGPYFDTDVWVPVPLIGQRQRDEGYSGGEGCQWCETVTFEPNDGRYALLGNDCAGIYRSTDGGKTWANATLGYSGRDAQCFAIDPHNSDRVYCLSSTGDSGVHFSDDGGCSWEPCFINGNNKNHNYNKRLAVDESSFDSSLGRCATVYWLTLKINGCADQCGLFCSRDGGSTWQYIEQTECYAGGELVCSKDGTIYIRSRTAIFRSRDGGSSFDEVYRGPVGSLCCVRTQPNSLYALVDGVGLIASHDGGDSFCVVTEGEFTQQYPKHLQVSPSNPSYMLMEDDHHSEKREWTLDQYYSHDGGRTWQPTQIDRKSGFFAPYNPRETVTTFHPQDENVVLSLGGDAVMRSVDGGVSFRNSSDGYNGVCIGASASFNVHNGNWVAIPAQDYNGGFSLDGGYTFTYVSWFSKAWGGHAYGSYVLDEQTVIAASATGWMSRGERFVAATYDGGQTVKIFEDCPVSGQLYCCGSARNPDIAFCAEWRTDDRARTWSRMEGCTDVHAADPIDGTLCGADGKFTAVISRDDGLTWQPIATFDSKIRDVAYSRDKNSLFVCLDDHLYEVDINSGEMCECNTGTITLVSVTVDPVDNRVVYVAGNNDIDYNFNMIMRSVDGGRTWTSLKRQPGDGRQGPDGARKPGCIRVNPTTRELWAFTWCYGIWKIAPPKI